MPGQTFLALEPLTEVQPSEDQEETYRGLTLRYSLNGDHVPSAPDMNPPLSNPLQRHVCAPLRALVDEEMAEMLVLDSLAMPRASEQNNEFSASIPIEKLNDACPNDDSGVLGVLVSSRTDFGVIDFIVFGLRSLKIC